jgi:protein-tyrosine phosphatase
LAPDETSKNKVHLLLDFLTEESIEEVPDPYYGTATDFQYVYDLLDRATNSFLAKIQTNTK